MEGLVIGGNFAFQNGFGLSTEAVKNTEITASNSSKQVTVTVHELILGRLIFLEGLFFFFWGGGGWGALVIGIVRYVCMSECLSVLEFILRLI